MARYHLFPLLLLFLLPHAVFLPADAVSGASWSDGMTFLGDATVKNGVLSLTSDENPSSRSSPPHSIGRALYSMPIRFLNSITRTPLSFSSRFTFSITALSSEDTFSGDGLALLITSDPQFLGCADGYLGLFCGGNASTALQGGKDTIGVEFDAWFNSFLGDPNGNHVAVDLGSISSVASADAGEAGVDLRSGSPVTAWVEYDFAEDSLRVWISGSGGTHRPPRPLLRVDRLGLAGHLREFMYVGFSASSSGRATAAHLVESWNFRTFSGSLPSSSPTPTPTPVGPTHGGSKPASPLQDCLIRFPAYQVASSDVVRSLCAGGKGGGDDRDWPHTPSFHTSSPPPRISRRKDHRHWVVPVLIAIPFAVLFSVLAIALLTVWLKKKKNVGRRMGNSLRSSSRDEKGPDPMQFPLEDIRQATSGFHESKILGRGATGTVYGGVLPSCGAVAVKRFDRAYESVNPSFLRQLAAVTGSRRHRNLVPLRGWCRERDELLLVYDYMPNGSLANHLHPTACSAPPLPPLAWERRREILLGLASAVASLHGDCERKIIHRDIKSCNVLLDAGFNARLSDLGLAELRGNDQTPLLQTFPMGTVGYLAPEFVHSGVATEATDVYSFGIVALEVGTGRKPLDKGVALVDWVWELHGRKKLLEAADPRLERHFDAEEMRVMLTVGLACAHPDYRQRPSMRMAIRMLKKVNPTPALPPKKPAVRLLSLGERKHHQEISAATSATVWHTPEHSLM